MKPEEIRKVLTRDGLAEAEKETGISYKENEAVMWLGFTRHYQIGQEKDALMKATDDTPFSCPLTEYLRIAQRIGFKIVLEVPFIGKSYSDEPAPQEKYYVLWRDGILLAFDTYGGDSINGGKFYYNWRYKDPWQSGVTSSGCCTKADKGVWCGDHDCREALVFHISELERCGTFLPQWIERPFLWLLHYMDSKEDGYDYKAITEARVAMLPEDVRKAITPVVST